MSLRHELQKSEVDRAVRYPVQQFAVQLVWRVSLALFTGATFAGQSGSNPPLVVEVFISDKHTLVRADTTGPDSRLRVLVVYEINAIQSVERALSLNLPVEPQQSKQIVLQRIQHLDAQTRSSMQPAATALAKAMQYGIDRFPAIVFDGQAVVYGVTDLNIALAYYKVWRAEVKP